MIKFTKEEKSHIFKRIKIDLDFFDQEIYIIERSMAFEALSESDLKYYEDRIANLRKAKEKYLPFYKKVEAWVNEVESTTKD